MVRADHTAFKEYRVLTSAPNSISPSRISHHRPHPSARPLGNGWPYRLAGLCTRLLLCRMIMLSKKFDSPRHEEE